MGINEILSYGFLVDHPLIEYFCANFRKFCTSILGPISDTDPTVDNYERIDVLVGHDPAGTSLKNV